MPYPVPAVRGKNLFPSGVAYLLRDEFSSGDTVSPRPSVPGPGTLTFQDGTKFSVTGGLLVLTGTGSRFYATAPITKANGIALGLTMYRRSTGALTQMYFSEAAATYNAGSTDDFYVYNSVNVYGQGTNMLMQTNLSYVAGEALYCVMIMRPRGVYHFIKGGGFTQWTLLGLTFYSHDTTLYATIFSVSTGSNRIDLDNVTLLQLGSPFDTEWGYATDYKASASSGESITMSADGFLIAEHTIVAAEVFEILFRRTDDDNCWIMRFDQTAGTIKLIEKQLGVESERRSAAWAPTVGAKYKFYIKTAGNSITVSSFLWNTTYNSWWNYNEHLAPYAVSSFNSTATNAKINGGSAVDFGSFPRAASAAAIAQLALLNL